MVPAPKADFVFPYASCSVIQANSFAHFQYIDAGKKASTALYGTVPKQGDVSLAGISENLFNKTT